MSRREAWGGSTQGRLPGIENSPSVHFASTTRSDAGGAASSRSSARGRGRGPRGRRVRKRAATAGGFDASTSVRDRSIPQYDASKDRNCPYTRSRKFQKHRQRMAKAEVVDSRNKHKAANLYDTAPASTGGGARRRSLSRTTPARLHSPAQQSGYGRSRGTTPSVRGPLSNQRGSVATPSGGITFARVQSADPVQEMEVLKTILLREGYLQRLKVMADAPNFAVTSEVVDLLDLLRLCTVEVVEAIMKWRRGLPKVVPFVWNGINYMLKLTCDIDFLDHLPALRRWLGFSMVHNPFIIPISLREERERKELMSTQGSMGTTFNMRATSAGGRIGNGASSVFGGTDFSGRGDSAGGVLGGTSSSFHEVGGRTPLTPAESLVRPKPRTPSGPKHPYQTAVINDPSLPSLRSPQHSRSRQGLGTPQAAGAGMELPSHIGDLDMMRVRDAEGAIELEEAHFGRFIMDPYGRLVPELRPIDADATAKREGRFVDDSMFGDSRPATAWGTETSYSGSQMAGTAGSAGGGGGPMPRRLSPMRPGGASDDPWNLEGGARGAVMSGAPPSRAIAPGGAPASKPPGQDLGGRAGSSWRPPDGAHSLDGGPSMASTVSFAQDPSVDGARHGRHRALKSGGVLTPLTKSGTRGLKSRPISHQSRSARVDRDLAKARDETRKLEQQLVALKAELAAEEVRIAQEAEALARTGAVGPDGEVGAAVVDERAEAELRNVEQKRRQIRDQESELLRKQDALERKEEHRERVRQETRDRVLHARNDPIVAKAAVGDANIVTVVDGDERKDGVAGDFEEEFGVHTAVAYDTRPMPQEMEEQEAATHIQRIARSRAARKAVHRRRELYNGSALRIQSTARGRKARVRVARIRLEKQSAEQIQRLVRGNQGRERAAYIRHTRLLQRCATRIQSVIRGRHGRKRMWDLRTLLKSADAGYNACANLGLKDLADLASLPEILPPILSLVHCALLLISPIEHLRAAVMDDHSLTDGTLATTTWDDATYRTGDDSALAVANTAHGRDGTTSLSHILSKRHGARVVNRLLPPTHAERQAEVAAMSLPWSTVRNTINQRGFLVRMRRLSDAAKHSKLIVPSSRISAVNACFLDPAVNQTSCLRLKRGVAAASALLIWVQSIVEVATVLPQFMRSEDIEATIEDTITAEHHEAQVDRAEEDADRKALARQSKKSAEKAAEEKLQLYVPERVLGNAMLRPRAMVLMVARDVPSYAATKIIETLLHQLPGVFVSLGREAVDIAAVQSVLNAGRSAICRVDIGIGARTRKGFLRAAATMKNSLTPVPQFVLVRGAMANRRGGGHNPVLGVGPADRQAMAKEDAMMKGYLETAADSVYSLRYAPYAPQDMFDLAVQEDPPIDAVLMLEAMIILLSPGYRFNGPNLQAAGASWAASHRMLLLAPSELASRCEAVDPNQVPDTNLVALEAYIRHEAWPRPGVPVGGVSRMGMRLVEWVVALTRYAALLSENGGMPPTIRKSAGVFSGVVTVADGIIRGDTGEWETQRAGRGSVHPQTAMQLVTDIEQGKKGTNKLTDAERQAMAAAASSAADTALVDSSVRHHIPESEHFENVRKRQASALGLTLAPTVLPASGAPPEFDGGFDGEGGWRDAYEDILRNVLRDMKVYSAAKRLGNVYTMVSVYRDCRRLFFGAYDPASSTHRFVATRDDLFHVNELLAPNSIEKLDPSPAPQTARQTYLRLVQLLRFVREPLSGRRVLHLQRSRVRLLRQTRKVDSAYMTITAYEEMAGQVVFEVYLPSNSRTLTFVVSESAIAALGMQTPTPTEREALNSGDVRLIGAALVDRLTFKRRRGQGLGTLSLRSVGEGGREIGKQAVKLGGLVRIVTCYETMSGVTTVVVYTPHTQSQTVFRLSSLERSLILRVFNAGQRHRIVNEIAARLRARPRLTYAPPLQLAPGQFTGPPLPDADSDDDAASAASGDGEGGGSVGGSAREGLAIADGSAGDAGVAEEKGQEGAPTLGEGEVAGLGNVEVVHYQQFDGTMPMPSKPATVVTLNRAMHRTARQIDRQFVTVACELVGGEFDSYAVGVQLRVELKASSQQWLLKFTHDEVRQILRKASPPVAWPTTAGDATRSAMRVLVQRLKWAAPRPVFRQPGTAPGEVVDPNAEPEEWASDLSDSESEDDDLEATVARQGAAAGDVPAGPGAPGGARTGLTSDEIAERLRAKAARRQARAEADALLSEAQLAARHIRKHPHEAIQAAARKLHRARAWLRAAKRAVVAAQANMEQAVPLMRWVRCARVAAPPSAPRHFQEVLEERRDQADWRAQRFRKAKFTYGMVKARAYAEALAHQERRAAEEATLADAMAAAQADREDEARRAAAAQHAKEQEDVEVETLVALQEAAAAQQQDRRVDMVALEDEHEAALGAMQDEDAHSDDEAAAGTAADADAASDAPDTTTSNADAEDAPQRDDVGSRAEAGAASGVGGDETEGGEGSRVDEAAEKAPAPAPTPTPASPRVVPTFASLEELTAAARQQAPDAQWTVGRVLFHKARRLKRLHRDARGNLPKAFALGTSDVDLKLLSAEEIEDMRRRGQEEDPYVMVRVRELRADTTVEWQHPPVSDKEQADAIAGGRRPIWEERGTLVGVRVEVYDPVRQEQDHYDVPFDNKAFTQVLGGQEHLKHPANVLAMAQFIAMQRVAVGPADAAPTYAQRLAQVREAQREAQRRAEALANAPTTAATAQSHLAGERVVPPSIPSFAVLLHRDHLFGADKVTPLPALGVADAQAQVDHAVVIRAGNRRGVKLLAQGVRVDGLYVLVTAFDRTVQDPPVDWSAVDDPTAVTTSAPADVRLLSYNPADNSKHSLELTPQVLVLCSLVDEPPVSQLGRSEAEIEASLASAAGRKMAVERVLPRLTCIWDSKQAAASRSGPLRLGVSLGRTVYTGPGDTGAQLVSSLREDAGVAASHDEEAANAAALRQGGVVRRKVFRCALKLPGSGDHALYQVQVLLCHVPSTAGHRDARRRSLALRRGSQVEVGMWLLLRVYDPQQATGADLELSEADSTEALRSGAYLFDMETQPAALTQLAEAELKAKFGVVTREAVDVLASDGDLAAREEAKALSLRSPVALFALLTDSNKHAKPRRAGMLRHVARMLRAQPVSRDTKALVVGEATRAQTHTLSLEVPPLAALKRSRRRGSAVQALAQKSQLARRRASAFDALRWVAEHGRRRAEAAAFLAQAGRAAVDATPWGQRQIQRRQARQWLAQRAERGRLNYRLQKREEREQARQALLADAKRARVLAARRASALAALAHAAELGTAYGEDAAEQWQAVAEAQRAARARRAAKEQAEAQRWLVQCAENARRQEEAQAFLANLAAAAVDRERHYRGAHFLGGTAHIVDIVMAPRAMFVTASRVRDGAVATVVVDPDYVALDTEEATCEAIGQEIVSRLSFQGDGGAAELKLVYTPPQEASGGEEEGSGGEEEGSGGEEEGSGGEEEGSGGEEEGSGDEAGSQGGGAEAGLEPAHAVTDTVEGNTGVEAGRDVAAGADGADAVVQP